MDKFLCSKYDKELSFSATFIIKFWKPLDFNIYYFSLSIILHLEEL